MSKLAIVTGGTKGIGKAIIEKFASERHDIITCSRNLRELQDLKRSVESQYGISLFIFEADLSKKKEVHAFTSFALGLKRDFDVLVNNAGVFKPGEVTSESEGTLEGMIEANVYSAYYTTRDIVISMKKRGKGHIFNMCSIASIAAYPNGGSYSISKFALLGFSKVLRAELKGENIRVTAVLPGATLTPSWEGVDLPAERFIKSEDVAEAVYGAYSLSGSSVVEELLIRPQLGDI